jgi:hypothetical protein
MATVDTTIADLEALRQAASTGADATEKFANAAKALGEIAGKYTAQYGDLLKASATLDALATAKNAGLYQEYVKPFEQAALIPRQLVAELAGASVLGLGEVSATAKALRDQS